MNKSILDTVHEIAKGLYEAGAMSDEDMREFDVLCKRSPAHVHRRKSNEAAKKPRPIRTVESAESC